MQYGIYYAYWAKHWRGDFIPYAEKVKRLGFDILEVACGAFDQAPLSYFRELRQASQAAGLRLTGGYGPRPEHNLASPDPAVVQNAFDFYRDIFPKLQAAGIDSLGGALYSFWPASGVTAPDRAGDLARSTDNMRRLADLAAEHGISLYMEVLNRFEGYLLNEAKEAAAYADAVGRDNVKVMLDTFHMNIEEDSLPDAIRLTGRRLGELHIGEANRRPPRPGRMPWEAIGAALREIGFDGKVVMEPFVKTGGEVGRDIRLWRDLSDGADTAALDREAARSVAFIRGLFAG
ncbi:MAG: sugar phosphate isomerase/epimerase [Oscillospiraceae bacterium]|jgi:D-psicose/D-tagatose/L-ribulose 3-epimerase|nr:sugar phosphate isomerase/epimerase [Oscillospiraceae bacterium]